MIKYLISILLIFFSIPVQAQVAGKNKIFVLDDFSGGLHDKSSPISQPKNESQIATNLRYDTQLHALTKRDKILVYGTASTSSPILGMHRLYLDDGTQVLLTDYSNKVSKGNDTTGAFTDILTLSQPSHKAQWETWHNIGVMTDGYNQPVKYDGKSSSATYIGSLLALDSGAGSGPNGTYTYEVSCYTASNEYSLGTPSNSLTVTNHAIALSMIPVCPDEIIGAVVVGRKIYRTTNGGSTYKLQSTIADNSTLTATDSTADGSLGATLTPDLIFKPPVGKLIAISNNRLWILNDPSHPSRAYYSEDSSHDIFLPSSYLDIRPSDGDEITCGANVLGKFTICKTNTIQKIYFDTNSTGDPATDWSISEPFSFVGNHAMYSAVNTPIGLIYLSNNGIYNFSGQYSELLSDPVTPDIKDISSSDISNTWASYFKNSYYLSYKSTASGASTNNRVMVYDLLTKAYDIDFLNINVFDVLRGGSDVEVLYSGSSINGNVYAHNQNTKNIIHKRQADFTGAFTNMRYIPTSAGGNPESPILELARTATIDALVGTIDSLTGTIDRSSTTGNYISQPLDINASTFDKIYWNEILPTSGSNVTFAVRSATNDSAISAASWSSEVSDPSGSDISHNTAGPVVEYRISMTTDNLAFSPTIYQNDNFNVKLAYNTAGATDETTIPFEWETGWMDLGAPAYKKTLRKIYVEYESGSSGTLNINFTNYTGQNSSFTIDLNKYPSEYIAYFNNGAFVGELFQMDISENSLNALKIKRITLMYDIEPIV